MLKKFTVENYKNLQIKDDLEFNPKLNIFIGPNNSGKSNLIDGMNFWADLLKVGVQQSLFKRNFKTIPNCYGEDREIYFRWTISIREFLDLTYVLRTHIPERDYHDNYDISFESLKCATTTSEEEIPFQRISQKAGVLGFSPMNVRKDKSFKFRNLEPKESMLNQIDLLYDIKGLKKFYPIIYETFKSIRSYFEYWKYYPMADIPISNIKSYSRLRGEEKFVNKHCDNFANVVRVIFPKYPSFKLQYFEYLRKFMPIDYMDYEIVGDRDVNLFIMVKDKRFELNELSDCTARLLLLLFILCSPEKPKVLFIDEPELNIHPAWLRVLSNVIRDRSHHVQIFLSTHSPELLDPMTELVMNGEANVYVFDRDGNIKPLSLNEELRQFVKDGWELGDLYRVGDPVIGGWPW